MKRKDAKTQGRKGFFIFQQTLCAFVPLCLCVPLFPATARAQDNKVTIPPVLGRINSAQRAFARLLQLEDQRNYSSEELKVFLHSPNARVRRRACLAVGRIGDERGTDSLIERLNDDGNPRVRALAAFGLGEIEAPRGTEDLMKMLSRNGEPAIVKARCAEALGKILANPESAKALGDQQVGDLVKALVASLPDPSGKIEAGSDGELFATLTITGLLRARKSATIPALAKMLKSPNASVRWHAGNALARTTGIPNNTEAKSIVPALIAVLTDENPIVRANAARALSPIKDPSATAPLVKLLDDPELNVRISAIRALGASKDAAAVAPLATRLEKQIEKLKAVPAGERAIWDGLPYALTLATALGDLEARTALPQLLELRSLPTGGIGSNPETEIAVAKLDTNAFLGLPPMGAKSGQVQIALDGWQNIANFCAGAEVVPVGNPGLAAFLEELSKLAKLDARARTALIPAFVKHNPTKALPFLLGELKHPDVLVRATAVGALAELPADEQISNALATALPGTKNDELNDARLAILDALAKYDTATAKQALQTALRDPDYLTRRKAGEILLKKLSVAEKERQEPDIRTKVGICRTGRDEKFYQRIVKLYGLNPQAIIETTKGVLQVELFPEDAPLNVDSFVSLSEKGFFKDITFHRVVPNFVAQGGDPRGDGNGGPGYQIRCEINERPYERGSMGMALSGKDTGASQFFFCHTPQPHLDGGYTVFGRVINGLDVMDKLTRGDRILSIEIVR